MNKEANIFLSLGNPGGSGVSIDEYTEFRMRCMTYLRRELRGLYHLSIADYEFAKECFVWRPEIPGDGLLIIPFFLPLTQIVFETAHVESSMVPGTFRQIPVLEFRFRDEVRDERLLINRQPGGSYESLEINVERPDMIATDLNVQMEDCIKQIRFKIREFFHQPVPA